MVVKRDIYALDELEEAGPGAKRLRVHGDGHMATVASVTTPVRTRATKPWDRLESAARDPPKDGRHLSDITERHNSRQHSGSKQENDDPSLQAQLFKYLKSKSFVSEHGQIASVTQAGVEATAEFMTSRGLWSAEALAMIGTSAIGKLSFEGYNGKIVGSVLAGFVPPMNRHFTHLHTISLAGTQVTDDDVFNLRYLMKLQQLNLESTLITSEAVFHLVSHKSTLKTLHLGGNLGIDDKIVPPFALLTALQIVYLRDTKVTMEGLRQIVDQRSPDIFRLSSIPDACKSYLTKGRNLKYCVMIPAPYLTKLDAVRSASQSKLKENLELHRKVNKDVVATGTKDAMMGRLRGILEIRKGDEAVMSHLGRLCESELE